MKILLFFFIQNLDEYIDSSISVHIVPADIVKWLASIEPSELER